MKKMKTVFMAALLSVNVLGGVGEGGGHPLETAVKERIKRVVKEIELIEKKTKHVLEDFANGICIFDDV